VYKFLHDFFPERSGFIYWFGTKQIPV